MENRYYTPSIEEFYIGFEYEMQLREDTWAKYTFPQYPRAGIEWNTDNPISIIEQIKKKYLRVKYLDSSDIESFGFIHIGALWFEDVEKSYRIRKWKENEIDIYKYWGSNDVTPVFKGKIKNKSELQQILKMIGVTE